MKIRSITLFSDIENAPANTRSFLETSKNAFHLPVQTTRIATTPFPTWWKHSRFTSAQAREAAQKGGELAADYLSLGSVQLRHDASWLDLIPEIIASSDVIFLNAEIADRGGQVDLGRCGAVGEVIKRLSMLQSNGFKNLYFAALANCPPGVPFFPTAYHDGSPPHFAIAVEAADLILAAVESANNLGEARESIVTVIEQETNRIAAASEELAGSFGIAFSGIDFTPSPYPTAESSIAAAFHSLGVPGIGAPGSLFAAAFFTEAIDRAQFPRCGFSGLMLPVLEDSVLAAQAGDGLLSISDLLSYAAVCGVGLDTVPLPGNIRQDTIAGILADVAALAVRLDKPLTARLLPLPGLEAGDPARFAFEYFADSQVMALIDEGVGHLLSQPARLEINSLTERRRA